MRNLEALIVVSLSGCMGSLNDKTEVVAVESNPLGVSVVEIMHVQQGGDPVLVIVGTDEHGIQKAGVTLRTGLVYVEPDWAEPVWVRGTDLSITAGDQTDREVAPGVEPHQTLEPHQIDLATFVRLHAVANAIEKEAGIGFTRRDSSAEVAFTAAACTPTTISFYKVDGSTNGNPTQCCQDVSEQDFKVGSGLLGRRQLATPCRASDNTNNNCTGGACYFGPCGSHSLAATGDTNAVVFTPNVNPNLCGWDDNGTATGGNNWPEAYVSQPLKAGLTVTCPNTWCVGGIATPGDKALQLTVTPQGTSYVTTNTPSYTMTGSMTSTATGYYFGGGPNQVPAAQSVTLTASAVAGYRAVWSGSACNTMGTTGALSTCVISMAVAQTQSVSWTPGCTIAVNNVTATGDKRTFFMQATCPGSGRTFTWHNVSYATPPATANPNYANRTLLVGDTELITVDVTNPTEQLSMSIHGGSLPP